MESSKGLYMYTVYRNPSDYPDKFVFRRFKCECGKPLPDLSPLLVTDSYDNVLDFIEKIGPLHCIPRQPEDDPVILETWI